MSRKRYITSDISIDARVNKVAAQSEFAVLLYTWMIPHLKDDAILEGTADEILLQVMPGFRHRSGEEVANALTLLGQEKLIVWTGEKVFYPIDAFLKHQTYISKDKRDNLIQHYSNELQKVAESSNNCNFAYLLPSPSTLHPTPSPTKKEPPCIPPKVEPQKSKRIKPEMKPIPDSIEVTDELRAYAKSKGYTGDLREFINHFLDTCKANGYVYADYDLALKNWLRREIKDGKTKPQNKPDFNPGLQRQAQDCYASMKGNCRPKTIGPLLPECQYCQAVKG